jgi:ATP-binding cassette subfamily F protein 3
LVKRYAEQQDEIAKTEALIRRFRYKASKAAFAQELIKRLDKMERIEIPETLKKINIKFPPPPPSPRVALTIEGLGKSYGSRQVLSGLDLTIDSGERLVVAGPNGAGKTTLLRVLSGSDADFLGTVKYGSGITIGYFSQDAAEAMSGGEQVLEFMEAEAPMALIPKVRDMLGAFLFRGDDVYKPVSVLSGGEKSRLALLRMLLKPMNLLILDEPTNHLDLHSKDILLDTLRQFKGTIIFVSHDRAFMEALSTKTLELCAGTDTAPSRVRLFYGNYAYYLEKINGEGVSINTNAVNTNGIGVNNQINKNAGEQRAQNKQRQTEIRRLERQEASALAAIEELEAEKAQWEAELSRPEVYSSGEKAKAVKQKLDECAAAIKVKTAEWEKLAAQLEKPFGGV